MNGAGSIILVRLGRGELGRDGGSWVGAGVLASFDIVLGCYCGWGGEDEVLGGAGGYARTRARRDLNAKARGLRELLFVTAVYETVR